MSQDAILQDEAKMNDINEKLEKFRNGSGTKSIRNDLSFDKIVFSEESSRCLRDGQHGVNRVETNLGDYSMFFLPEARTRRIEHVSMRRLSSIQSKYVGPNQNSVLQLLKTPYYRTRDVISRGKKSGHNPWQQEYHKAMDAKRGALKRGKYTSVLDRWQNDEVFIESPVAHGWTASTSTTSPRLTSVIMRLADRDYDITTLSTSEQSIPRNKQDHCVNDMIKIISECSCQPSTSSRQRDTSHFKKVANKTK